MIDSVVINKQTKSLIDMLYSSVPSSELAYLTDLNDENKIQIDGILSWLGQIENQTLRFEQESLRAALLHDLHHALKSYLLKNKDDQESENIRSWWKKCLFILLATAGTLLALCDGFDGMASVLSLFIGIPIWLIFLAGTAFSLLSLTVFYGFDLDQISQNLGVGWSQSRKILDVFIEQIEAIKLIRKLISKNYKAHIQNLMHENKNYHDDLDKFEKILSVLIIRHDALIDVRKMYLHDQKQMYLNVVKFGVAIIAGLLFFSYGFFSGQSLALAILGLFMTSVSLTFWPLIVISVAMGLASVSLYWFVERPGLQNLVSSWLGFDEEKIMRLTDEMIVTKEKNKMTHLKQELGFFSKQAKQCDCASQTEAALFNDIPDITGQHGLA